MSTIKIFTGVLMLIMTAITIICGMWIKTNHITDPGSFKFHMISGGISAVLIAGYFIMTMKFSK